MQSYETIDVRQIPSSSRHQQILDKILHLKVEEGLILIVDHDPKPLYYLLKEEHNMQFKWKYMKKGPVVWQLLLIRNSGVADMLLEDIIGNDLSRLLYFARIDPSCSISQGTRLQDVLLQSSHTADEIMEAMEDKPTGQVNHYEYWDLTLFEQYIQHNYHQHEVQLLTTLADTMDKVIKHHLSELPQLQGINHNFIKFKEALMFHHNGELELFNALRRETLKVGWVQQTISEMNTTIVNLLREMNICTDEFTPPEDACPLTRHLYLKLSELYDDVVCHLYVKSKYLPLYIHDN